MVTVNEEAPVLAKAEIVIEADPDTVWRIMANIEAWPSWNPDVKSALLRGELKKGTPFQWKAGSGKITSILGDVEPPRLLSWSGKIMGVNAIHVCKIDFVDGKTIVRTEESWEGLLSHAMHGRMQKMLESTLKSTLEYLKAEAERVSSLQLNK